MDMHSLAVAAGSSSHKAPWILFVGLILVGVASVFARQMWSLNRWRYANPSAMQPSERYFTFERIIGALFIAAGVVGLIVTLIANH